MRLTLFAVGRMKAGPERELADRYVDRLAKLGPKAGLIWDGIHEIAESRARSPGARKADESAHCMALADAPGTALIALDETGKSQSSRAFADALAEMRDIGVKRTVFAIGGPDGHNPALLARADRVLCLGAMTWPHQLARALLAEQLYRAASILAGHPYHRN
ncbi:MULTISPECIES: 23S rRNA (pseudouridine(1915)-N(3))-methyltransferase RlmH [unclassified Roseitalea]|uniref:23S rRNA (pseudouridine(1915)-N(3))-methyltransferase RlmH n=1 Tax=unclassified Roseitalea TaxID=2639107 RepID=UPI00273F0D1C|nr:MULTISPECIES: 23S rRNA (pseudouridine(1915)-N(3))-methyltransferase RlmH [unclassified Roseitalea]